jgi:hypothetical protein
MTWRAASARPYSAENRRKMIHLGVVQAVKDLAADGASGASGSDGGDGGREAGTLATKKRKKEPKVGLAAIARHVIDTHFDEPSFREVHGII